jgi:hypothetical protein
MSDDIMKRILDRLTSIENGQILVSTGITGLRTDVMARLDRHQDVLTAIRDDLAVNFGAVETVRKAGLNTREELRLLTEEVSAMHRQIYRLQTQVRELRGEP